MGLKFAAFARFPINMRVFALKPDHLRILDTALHGRLADALAEVAREGGDPVLCVERVRSADGNPSPWYLHVLGGSQPRRFEITDVRVLGVIAHVYLVDHIEDLKNDLRLRVTGSQTDEQLEFNFRQTWSPPHPADPS